MSTTVLRRSALLRTVFAWVIGAAVLVVVLVQYSPQALQRLPGSFHSSSSAATLICPSPFLGRPKDAFSASSSFSPFSLLASSHPDFTLSLSYSTKHCNAFRLRMARKDRSQCDGSVPELNEDKATTRFVQGELGPETFQLQIDGAERLVVDDPAVFDREECAYEYEVALANSGAAWLQVAHLYKDYNAYTSTPKHEIPRLLTPLLDTPLQLSFCDSSCTPYSPPLLSKRASVLRAETDTSPAPPPSLPACTGPQPIRGSYVPSALPSLLYPPHQLPMTPSRPSAGFHTFVPSGCSFQHDGLRFRDHASCVRKKRSTLFIGDSHTRGLYDVMLHRLEGNDEMALTSFKVANKAQDIEKLHLEFLWDPFLQSTPSCSFLTAFDSLVLSSGSHQACYKCPPTREYLAAMEKVFTEWPDVIAQCRDRELTRALVKREERRTKSAGEEEEVEEKKRAEEDEQIAFLARPFSFIFVTSPAWYPQAVEKYDCRTAQRMGRWNDLATDLALKEGWSVVDAGALTKPIQQDTRFMDGVHYIKTDAIDPMVDEVVEKLGICGNESVKRL
ncbi:hypothetical protein JCM6882_006630 [Rhodosporidiobolus microsporus]